METSKVHTARHSVHPFPARMAPELAFESLERLDRGSVVLDPMSGSGTVLRQANEFGLSALGFDMDPLAVLMARVWTTPVRGEVVLDLAEFVLNEAKALRTEDVHLDWMDSDSETSQFVAFWFAEKQLSQMRKLSYILACLSGNKSSKHRAELDVLRIALSRIVITKEQCASLARDTSHSRPHRVSVTSEYCCFIGFDRSVKALCTRLLTRPPVGGSLIALGDVRKLRVESQSIGAVLTSPPYLNAIDYMRGHRMSLVWLGYRLATLREIRSDTLGAERGPDSERTDLQRARNAMGSVDELPPRYRKMIDRYINDVQMMMGEIARVLIPKKRATLVVGNSCLRGVYIDNSSLVRYAADEAGLKLLQSRERPLPDANRYLPTSSGMLSKRMRVETILTFSA